MKGKDLGLVGALLAASIVAAFAIATLREVDEEAARHDDDEVPEWMQPTPEFPHRDAVAEQFVRPELEEMTLPDLAAHGADMAQAREEDQRPPDPHPRPFGCSMGVLWNGHDPRVYAPPFDLADPATPGVVQPVGDWVAAASHGHVTLFAQNEPLAEQSPTSLELEGLDDERDPRLLTDGSRVVAFEHDGDIVWVVDAVAAEPSARAMRLPRTLEGPDEQPMRFAEGIFHFYSHRSALVDPYAGRRSFAQSRFWRPVQPSRRSLLHEAIACDLRGAQPRCTRHAVVAPEARLLFASEEALYLWVHPSDVERERDERARPVLYRVPFDLVQRPGAIRVAGAAVSPHAMRETPSGTFEALIYDDDSAAPSWSSETTDGDVALLRVRPSAWESFQSDDGVAFVSLPRPIPGFCATFVGEHLLYGGDCGVERASLGARRITVFTAGEEAQTIDAEHPVRRIAPAGERAALIGSGPAGIAVTLLRLEHTPTLGPSARLPYARERVRRGWGLAVADRALAFPVIFDGRGDAPRAPAARVLRLTDESLVELGRLDAPEEAIELRDAWFARDTVGPRWIGGALYARLGDHLVVGREGDGTLISEAAPLPLDR